MFRLMISSVIIFAGLPGPTPEAPYYPADATAAGWTVYAVKREVVKGETVYTGVAVHGRRSVATLHYPTKESCQWDLMRMVEAIEKYKP